MDGEAKKLGERLLGEVQSEGLSELFASLRELSLSRNHNLPSIFGIPKLDALLQPNKQNHHQPNIQNTTNNNVTASSRLPLTIDLISPPYSVHPSGGGKSTLTNLLIVHAVLPPSLLGVPLNGASSSIVLIDPLSHFRASRLAEFLLHHVTRTLSAHGLDVRSTNVKDEVLGCVRLALAHVLIFRPCTWESLMATLDGLPSYLFNDEHDDGGDSQDGQHRPPNPLTHRKLHAIVLEDLHFFTPHLRSSSSRPNVTPSPPSLLTPHLHTLHKTLQPSLILLTSLAHLPLTNPSPAVAAYGGITRLAVRRVDVTKFASGISVEEAEAERALRWEVVRRARFEVWRVGGSAGEGVVFRVRGAGDVVFEGGDDSGGGGREEVATG